MEKGIIKIKTMPGLAEWFESHKKKAPALVTELEGSVMAFLIRYRSKKSIKIP